MTKHYWAVVLSFLVGPAQCAEPASVMAELRTALISSGDDAESLNPVVRMWSFLELVPAAGKVDSVFVPSAHTSGESTGPSRIVFLPAPVYELSMFELVRRRISARAANALPSVSFTCVGDATAFTDCCTQSPTLACVEDARTLAPETSLPVLVQALYAATAVDVIAVELGPQVISFTLSGIKQRSVSPNSLYLYLGQDDTRPGNLMLIKLDATVLSKLALLIKRLETQISGRKGDPVKLAGHLSCSNSDWKVIPSGTASAVWLGGSQPVVLRGPGVQPHVAFGLVARPASLVIAYRESATEEGGNATMFSFMSGNGGAASLAACMGPRVGSELDQAKPVLNILKGPEVSGFLAAWLQLAGTIAVLSAE